ncbi:MAG: T9SS type A sorting domain-containing protein [Hymenobacter sp.]|nr:T9SS type A sorting domain-containing protein [Hymenobacter sp.]
MQKNLLAGLALVAALCAPEQATAQTAGFAQWPLQANNQDNPAVRSAGLTAAPSTFRRFVVSNGQLPPGSGTTAYAPYSTVGQAFGVQADGGGWSNTAPGVGPGGNPRRTFYEQFTVTATAPTRLDSLLLTSSVFLSANGRLAALYSLSNFVSDSVSMAGGKGPGGTLPAAANGTFGTGVGLANAAAVVPQYTDGVPSTFRFALTTGSGLILAAGQTLTLRIYFGVGSTSAGRYVLLRNVTLKSQQIPLASKSAVAKQTLKAYPNPTQDNLLVAHPAAKKGATVTMYSANGRKVASFAAQPGTTATDLRLSTLAAGIYLAEYSDGQQRITAKVVKQ